MTKNKPKRKPRASSHHPAPASDRLSDLPDPIIHIILFFLFIDESVRTSVLSSRWRHLWRTNPSLRFSFSPLADPDSPPRFTDYVEIISRCLRLCAPVEKLRAVTFPLPDDSSKASTLARWIRFASDRSVEHLSFYQAVLGGGRLPVPLSLFACGYLVSLKMQSCTFGGPVPASSRFSRLESLVLDCVHIPTETFASLLDSAPFLENLSLSSCRKLTRIAISSSSLKKIAISASEDLEKFVIINAPKLRHFTYFGEFAKLGPLDQVRETLEEATLISNEERPFENKCKWRDFIYALENVKVLCIGAWFLQYELERNLKSGNQMPLFKNLRELHWWPVFKEGFGPTLANPKFSIRALVSVLQNCPTLGFLCIHLNYYWEQFAEDLKSDDYLFISDYSSDENSDEFELDKFQGLECNFNTLNSAKLIEYSGKKVENQIIEFLLSYAKELKSLEVYFVPELELSEKERMSSELRTLHEMSRSNCSISFEEFLPSNPCSHYDCMLGYKRFDEV